MTLYGQCGYAHTLRHSVGYGILHQRLKSQRRHSHAQGILVTVPNHQQALSETVLLKPEVALNKIDLLSQTDQPSVPVSYTHLRAHETDSYLVCRLLLEKKKKKT